MSFTDYPQQLGKYRIDSLLGQGAMGVVYKAFDTEIDREVAIKILHTHLLEGEMGEELVQRFAHEVKAAARCQHANIVTVYDYGINQGQPYMAMEYVNGIDLHVFLKSGQSLTIEQAINLVLKVLDALYSAHTKGVVHRDIKPANIMLLDDGQVKVTDFGVARIDSSDLTQLGDVMGTPSYMSPEAQNGEAVTASSDLYAVALVFLELLLHKRVKIKALDYATLLQELIERHLTPQLAKNIIEVLKKALQPDSQQRYADALAFSKALTACLENSFDYYQMTNDLAATVLTVKSTIQQTKSSENMDSLFEEASTSVLLQSQLSLIEKSLVQYLGPVAKMLVKKQAKSTHNMNQLLNSLIAHIPSETERKKFISSLDISSINYKNDSSGTSKFAPSTNNKSVIHSFSPEYIEYLTTDLTQYLGPVAKHLMKSVLKQARSKEELCHCLAEKIPNLQERAKFLQKCNTLS